MQIPLKVSAPYNAVIFRIALPVLVIAVVFDALPVLAGSDIAAIQSKLKDMGLYYGETDGGWGDETSAAVTRYQIRQGLEINGRLTEETLRSLGLTEDGAPPTEEQPRGDAWKILREQDLVGLDDLPSEPESTPEEPVQRHTIVSVPSLGAKPSQSLPDTSHVSPPAATPTSVSKATSVAEAMPSPTPAVPSTASENASPAEVLPPRAVPIAPRAEVAAPREVAISQTEESLGRVTQNRLRDYIGAYVLAGLAPSVEPELEFFADEVNYFGKRGVGKEVIRRDLEQYNAQYPQRRFWLAGEPQIQSETDEVIWVDFPLRFEVNGASGSKSGKVLKSVELRKIGRSLEIIAVDERRMN